MSNELPYYNFGRVLSFNAVFNFIAGARGLGKTYGAKTLVIRRAIRTSEQFIYLRRYGTELAGVKQTFFSDVEHQFPDYDFRSLGSNAQMSPVDQRSSKKRQWQTIGYFLSLSKAQQLKSTDFSNVTSIIFDEFIIEEGSPLQYLKGADEAMVFENFFNTVDRYKDKTKVMFLANSASMMNPYFIKYGIEPDKLGEFTRILRNPDTGQHFGVVHFPESSEFQSAVYQTRFGRMIQDTEYADYAVGNKFKDASTQLTGGKPVKATYMYSLMTNRGTFSLWYDLVSQQWFADQKRPKLENILTMDVSLVDRDVSLVERSGRPLSQLRTAYGNGMLIFDSPQTRNMFTEVFKK